MRVTGLREDVGTPYCCFDGDKVTSRLAARDVRDAMFKKHITLYSTIIDVCNT